MRTLYTILFIAIVGFSTNSYSQSKGFQVIKNLEIIDLIYQNLDKYFVDEPKIGQITKVGIDAMLEELDPYTVYYPQSNIEDYRLMTTGQYGGIGALIRDIGDYVVIAEPYKGKPADKAGLKAGDLILSIDGNSMKDKNSEVVSKALKGPKETNVIIKVKRPAEGEKEITVTREEIKLPDVPYSGMVDKENKIGYVKLRSFTRTASQSVKKAYLELQQQDMKKFILDLRGNGGGLLHEAIEIVNFFVPKETVIVTTKGRILDENRVYATHNEPIDLSIPIVVLVNGRSASASEIVSGSLQDLDRGVVVGKNTFGKGLVQRTVDLKYGAKMKLTIAKYYTPSGRCVQKLDYYHKNDGEVEKVPDSLIEVFHTKNGREVISGRGVYPDIKIEPHTSSRLAVVLIGENIIFDFATQFTLNNPTIPSADEFTISDEVYHQFTEYVLKQDFEYETAAEEKLEEVYNLIEKEGLKEKMNGEYEALHSVLTASKKEDLKLYEGIIKNLLANEIVSRYYYQKGRVVNAFQHDDALKEAIKVLNNKKKYTAILTPQK